MQKIILWIIGGFLVIAIFLGVYILTQKERVLNSQDNARQSFQAGLDNTFSTASSSEVAGLNVEVSQSQKNEAVSVPTSQEELPNCNKQTFSNYDPNKILSDYSFTLATSSPSRKYMIYASNDNFCVRNTVNETFNIFPADTPKGFSFDKFSDDEEFLYYTIGFYEAYALYEPGMSDEEFEIELAKLAKEWQLGQHRLNLSTGQNDLIKPAY